MTIQDADLTPVHATGVNRRNLLKGAVAAGVGVVAWSSPSVTSIGMTPAYAETCTGGSQRYFLGGRNTSCNCVGVGTYGTTADVTYVNYDNPKFECDDERIVVPPRPVTHNIDENGECPRGTTANNSTNQASATIAAADPGELQYCKITIEVWHKNFCLDGTFITSAGSGIVGAEGGTVYLPAVSCASFTTSSDIFFKMFLECAVDEACLY